MPSLRKRERAEQEDLRLADQVAEEQVIKPTTAEKNALSAYCTLSLVCKRAESDSKAQLAEIKPKIKLLRQELSLLPENAVFKLPRKNDDDPKYLRVTKNTKDISITPDILKEAFDALKSQPSDVIECEEEDCQRSIILVLLANVRRLVRSYQNQAKLTDSLPRGTKDADVPQANPRLADSALELHEKTCLVLETEKQKREKIAIAKAEMSKKEPAVDSYFVRANMTSQRVNLENTPYNLCRRTSVLKPKLTFKILEALFQEEISGLKGGFSTKEDFVSQAYELENIKQSVIHRLSTLEPVTKVTIHLQKLGVRK
jgi:hypothetical protein